MSTLAFAVRRREPELVGPAAPTPCDTKRPSDMGSPPAHAMMPNVFAVSDHNRHAGFHRVDFGWGMPVFGGCVTTVFQASFLVAVRGGDAEAAVAVPIMLPRPAMDRFAAELEMTLTCPVGSAAPPPPRGSNLAGGAGCGPSTSREAVHQAIKRAMRESASRKAMAANGHWNWRTNN